MEGEVGVIYLLHFDTPYKHAQHYLGFAIDDDHFTTRIANHRLGRGARLTEVLRKAKIGFTVALKLAGTRTDERRLKSYGGFTRYCPLCRPRPRRFRIAPVV